MSAAAGGLEAGPEAGGEEGSRAGGTAAGSARLGARSRTPATRRRALAGPGLRAATAGRAGRGGAGDLRVCLCPRGLGRRPLPSRPLPARSPLRAPARLRAQVQVYTMPRGASSAAGLSGGAPLGAAAGAPAWPPPPSGPCPRPGAQPGACGRGAGGRGPRPGIIGSRRGPQGAGEGGGGRAPRRLRGGGRKWQPGTTRPPAPPPGSRPSSARRGGGPGRPPGAGRGVIGGPGRGTLRSDLPPATCGWGSGVPADLGGAAGVGRVPLGGHTSPRRVGWRAGGTSCLAPPCPRRGPWEPGRRRRRRRWRRRSVGAGRGRAKIPGRGRGGRKTQGWEPQGLGPERGWWGRPGSPPAAAPTPLHTLNTHADTLTHTHPRWAGADVSLKASHPHGEGRGLAEAADRGLRPHVPAPRETPSFRAAGGLGPCPALTPAPLPLPPPSPSALTELARVQGPPPASPSPPSLGPAALWLPNCFSLSWRLPSWGHPLPSLSPPLVPPFLSIPSVLPPLSSAKPVE